MYGIDNINQQTSHPEWVRGLKQLQSMMKKIAYIVAPRVGAWIETEYNSIGVHLSLSHPEWVRGLKHAIIKDKLVARNVAPRVGAWIETE